VNRAVFLDRDGIINIAYSIEGIPYPPRSIDSTILIDGIKELIDYLDEKGFIIIVVSNQPDVARGIQTKTEIRKITKYLSDKLPKVKEFYYCFHDKDENCSCRKPKIGLLLLASMKYGIDLSKSWMIGDRWKDITAGKNAGCHTIFVDYNRKEELTDKPDFTVKQVGEIIGIFKKELQ